MTSTELTRQTPHSVGPPRADEPLGLTSAEVARLIAEGKVNTAPATGTKSVAEIVRANVVTPFNVILGILLVVTLIIGPWQDAAFGFILLINLLIGTVQQLRAKRRLDRLAVLTAPHARVIRDGGMITITVDRVVLGDTVVGMRGDQVVADGVVDACEGLEVNEALLTGESEPLMKGSGDHVMAGSFITSGRATYCVTAVGADCYGQRIGAEAQRRPPLRSELVHGINILLATIGVLLIPMGVVVALSQTAANDTAIDALRASIAAMVTLVPQGLVLLTSVGFALGVIRLTRRGVVVSELAAVEPLARVDTLCIDKTGTLTTGEFSVAGIDILDAQRPVVDAAAAVVAADADVNATAAALSKNFTGSEDWQASRRVPFSSSRRWSAATFSTYGTWIVGAPEVVADAGGEWRPLVERRLSQGQRVLLVCTSDEQLDDGTLPAHPHVAGVIGLHEVLRDGVRDTVTFLQEAGVDIKVLSGDNAQTAAAVAARAGISDANKALNASELSTGKHLNKQLATHTVFGRVEPQTKLDIVHALQERGRVVAMTGDGVNDVLALRDADVGIAMGSGSDASRGVARLVLLQESLTALPTILTEGRRVLANVERAAALFISKTVFAAVLILAAAWFVLPFPLFLRHLTVVDAIAIGIPAFVLTLTSNHRIWRRGFLRRTLTVAIPSGLIIGAAAAMAYELALNDLHETLGSARSLSAIVLAGCILTLVYVVARERELLATLLVVTMAALFAAVLAIPRARQTFSFDFPSLAAVLTGVGVTAIAMWIMTLTSRLVRWAGHAQAD